VVEADGTLDISSAVHFASPSSGSPVPAFVAQGVQSFDRLWDYRLAVENPGEILAPSDFFGAARLSEGGESILISLTNLPVRFKLPGSCTGKRVA